MLQLLYSFIATYTINAEGIGGEGNDREEERDKKEEKRYRGGMG